MMGRTHSLAGAAGWLAIAPHIPGHGPAGIVLGTVIAAGAALWPDLDHPNGTIAHTYGSPSRSLCRVVERVSGGHREATHSLLAAAVATGVAAAAVRCVWVAVLVVWLCVGPAVRAAGIRRGRVVMAVATAGVAVVGVRVAGAGVVPWAVGAGYLTHLGTDAMTVAGIPVAWPDRRRVRVAAMSTGGFGEQVVVVVLGAGMVVLSVVAVVSPGG